MENGIFLICAIQQDEWNGPKGKGCFERQTLRNFQNASPA